MRPRPRRWPGRTAGRRSWCARTCSGGRGSCWPTREEDAVIDQKAGELGRLLGQSDEYKALVRASERMKEDATCRQLLAEVERIAQDIERATQEGREPPKDQVEQYDRALQSVQANPVYQQVVAAQANFEKLMAKVNARIYEGMKQGAASPIITLG
ncbi:MAG: hypothetical protein DMD65_01105 [Gemmatimonadetes bacterium]|nr:MAG: hypothetical protein DMD65_01105 [Gemmatimonadota bacterium]